MRFKTLIVDEFDNIGGAFGNTGNYFFIFASFFQIISSLCLIISWDTVLLKVSRFHTIQRQNNIKVWTKNVKIFCGLITLFLAVFLSFGFLYEAILILSFISLCVTVFYILAAIRFVRTFKDLTTESRLVDLTVALVRRVSIITAVCSSLVVIGLIAFFLTGTELEEKLEEDQINYALLIRDITTIFGLISSYTVVWYINSVTEGAVLADEYPVLCSPFRWWDSKNTEMLTDVEDDRRTKVQEKEEHVLDTNLLSKDV